MSQQNSTSKQKPKHSVTRLRSAGSGETNKSISECTLEQQATWLEKEVPAVRCRLADIEPVIIHIREHFKGLKPGQTFRGCANWTQYCETKLGCTAAGVRMMELRRRRLETGAKKDGWPKLPKKPAWKVIDQGAASLGGTGDGDLIKVLPTIQRTIDAFKALDDAVFQKIPDGGLTASDEALWVTARLCIEQLELAALQCRQRLGAEQEVIEAA
jgi:hypothetical protein